MLAVWRRTCEADTVAIDVKKYLTRNSVVCMTYPKNPMGAEYSFDTKNLILTIRLPKQKSARFFEIEVN